MDSTRRRWRGRWRMRGTGSKRQHTRSRWHLHLFKSRAPRRQEPRRIGTSRQRVATAQSGVGLRRPLRSPLWRTLRRPRRRAARPKEVGAVCARARRSRRRSPRRAGHAPLEPRGGVPRRGVPRGGNRRVQGDQLVARPPCGTRKSSSTRMMSTRDLRDLRDLLSTCPRICRFRREVERGSLYIHCVHMRIDHLTPRLGPCTICSTTLARAR